MTGSAKDFATPFAIFRARNAVEDRLGETVIEHADVVHDRQVVGNLNLARHAPRISPACPITGQLDLDHRADHGQAFTSTM